MLNLWLVYDAERRARNGWMIEHYIECGAKQGIKISLIDEHLPLPAERADAAIIRCVAPQLRAECERLGIPVHNPTEVAAVTNDKWSSYQYFSTRGIPMLETYRATVAPPLAFPFVAKPVDGHGGAGVELIQNEQQWANYSSQNDVFLAQELADTPGVDLRIYLLGGEIVAAMLRESASDFRSNFSLGGSARFYELGAEERGLVEKILVALPSLRGSFVGIDLMPHGGGWVLNEIEDVVGTRMLYTHTDIDIVPEHLRFIVDAIE
ncbi:ATP-grasp domain-containing protein [Corynebacterium lubricantis]|uniref:ATP-grasp domain-containing protein n=1 Tax=Corynebacterium lubricantis TaxID=541095 RepID=UPI000364BCAD|nr:ATP-grasp domain-containing protein [Corynebacterium lubricantis]